MATRQIKVPTSGSVIAVRGPWTTQSGDLSVARSIHYEVVKYYVPQNFRYYGLAMQTFSVQLSEHVAISAAGSAGNKAVRSHGGEYIGYIGNDNIEFTS